MNITEKKNAGKYYSAAYYLDGCGPDYNDRDFWCPQFQKIAEKINSIYQPRTFLDVGCAYGYLVEALRDLGVDAYGVDVSEYAISQVREDIRPYCRVCDAVRDFPKDFPERFDCISSIEVAEHLYEEDAQPFIHMLCSHANRIVFSSTPDDFKEPSHFNVQQQEYWAKRFAQEGFLHDLNIDLSFLSPQAIAFQKEEKTYLRLIEDYEHTARLHRMELKKVIDNKDDYIAGLTQQIDDKEQELEACRAEFVKWKDCQRQVVREFADSSYSYLLEEQNKAAKAKNEASAAQRERDAIAIALAAAREHEQQLQSVHDQIVNSTFWRLTWPGRRFVSGIKKLAGRLQTPVQAPVPAPATESVNIPLPAKTEGIPVAQYMRRLYSNVQPIPTVVSPDKVPRLNLVVDSIEKDHLFGGAATALIVATEFAKKSGMGLRLITREAPAVPQVYLNTLALNNLTPPDNVEYYSDYDRDEDGQKITKLPVSSEDVFFATSWWSAKAIEKTSLRKRFYYILQEVETFFYPHNIERLFCSQVMHDPNIDFIVNSHYLWEYFKKSEPNIVEHGVYFEPAFSKTLYKPVTISFKRRKRLFFYARPNNPRNLFPYGVFLLDMAIRQGIIDTAEWEICCAGQDIPDIVFSDGTRPVHSGLMSWQEYRDFVSEVDLALSLMYTPHPSYPPFDVAVSGGVVVTNKYMNKQNFPGCKNVLMGDLEPNSFMETMRQGVALACDLELRKKNYEEMSIPRNWADVLEETLSKMGEWL